MTALGNEDVGWLDVAVDDSLGVGGIQCIGDLDCQTEVTFDLDRLSCDAVLQRHSIQKLHHDERLATVFADLVNRADIGMIQGGGCPAPHAGTGPCLRILATSSGRNFRATKRSAQCPRPCRPHPSRRHPASRRCGNARWFDRSCVAEELRVPC